MTPDQSTKSGETGALERFNRERSALLGLAYRMLGTRFDAEDIVQDVYLKWQGTDLAAIRSDAAFLRTVTSRSCIDRLRVLQRDRGQYTGPWLPEPIPGEHIEQGGNGLSERVIVQSAETQDAEQALIRAQGLSMGLLRVMELLTPNERAVFVLREAFDYSFDEISSVLNASAATCRQWLHRARQKMRKQHSATQPAQPQHLNNLLAVFAQALDSGDLAPIEALLAADATAYTDGGGKVSAALIPLEGAPRIIQVFVHLWKKNAVQDGFTIELIAVNDGWALLSRLYGEAHNLLTIDVDDNDRIVAIYVVRNPDKLRLFQV